MSKLFLFLTLSVLICITACSSNEKMTQTAAACPCADETVKEAPADDFIPNTTTQAIHHEQKLIGYLDRCGEGPLSKSKLPAFPPGTLFIQNEKFVVVGVITPQGTVWRLGDKSPIEKINQADMMKNLATFFNVSEDKLTVTDI